MLIINQLGMRYGGDILFEDVTLELNSRKRYGITGANGAGKSTLLRLISGEESLTSGSIDYSKEKMVGFLKQDHFRYENDRVLDVVMQGNPRLWQALQEKEILLNQTHHTEAEGLALGHLEEIINAENGYSAHAVAHELLNGLGIPQSKHFGPLGLLSGGFKLRTLFAQLLFSNPDILLLDEPTNHLDIVSINWLSEFLQESFRGVLLFVSHDRDFLNSVSTHILDIDYHTVTPYPGNYEAALKSKAERAELREKTRAGQDKKIAHLQSFVDRFGAKASKAKQAQSRVKQIEKMELEEIKLSTRLTPHLQFPIVRQSGKVVMEAKDIAKSFGDLKVLNNVSFTIQRGDKVGVIGPNGMGKSTLLKILLDKLQADQGTHTWGFECYPAYFAQDHHELLFGNKTVLDWLMDHASNQNTQVVRNALGQVLFTGDDHAKNIANLSGGESTRLLLANLMLAKQNILILDEPTNHLDLESIDALANALAEYEGTVICVSHDKYFLEKMATRILAIQHHGIEDYAGTYAEYLADCGQDFLSHLSSVLAPSAKKETSKSGKNKSDNKQKNTLEKELQRLQTEIEQLEKGLSVLASEFSDTNLYLPENAAKLKKLEAEKTGKQAKLNAVMEAWERAAQDLEAL